MTSADSLKKSLQLYLRSSLYFASTTSGKPFVTNAILSNKPLTGIANPSHAAVVYESAPAPDGTRAVAFADGHVERFAEAQWLSIARASGINTPRICRHLIPSNKFAASENAKSTEVG